jgi:mono/diheme cytochrome c family protein
MRKTAAAAISIGVLLATAPAYAQTAQIDQERGRDLATRFCATCHDIGSGAATMPRPEIPSFAVIARRPNNTAERIAGAIIIPHPAMPEVQLTMGEIRSLVAYILSLKTGN